MVQRVGSTRIMTPVEPGVIALRYTDRWSAFDRGASPQLIPKIGAARCACAVKSFQLAHAAGLPTHFIEQVDSVTIHVQEFSIPGHEPLSGKVHGQVLDREWIWRDRVKGSLLERLQDGRIDPVSLGFVPGTAIIDGMKLPLMRLESTTKFEKIDRHLSEQEAQERAGLTDAEEAEAWDLIRRIVNVTNTSYEKAGFYCPDGKCELGRLFGGGLIGVDVFGTQAENRILDKAADLVFSKDIIRNHLIAIGWKAELERIKKEYPTDKSKWPEYPTLPAEIVDIVSKRYCEVARRYAGVSL